MQNPANSAPKSKRAQIKALFIHWSHHNTFHCYPKIFEYEHVCAKLLWTLLFLTFTCLTSLLVVRCVADFFAYDVVSCTQSINERPLAFPTVTICNNNAFTTQTAERLLHNITVATLGRDLANMTFQEVLHSKFPLVAELAKMLVSTSNYCDTNKMSLGFSLERILNCVYGKNVCDKSRDFSWYYSYAYGNCFQFNSARLG